MVVGKKVEQNESGRKEKWRKQGFRRSWGDRKINILRGKTTS